jgi:hypothetical protein
MLVQNNTEAQVSGNAGAAITIFWDLAAVPRKERAGSKWIPDVDSRRFS